MKLFSVLGLPLHNHLGISSRCPISTYICKILHTNLTNIHLASKRGSTQVFHISIMVIFYTTISTVSFSTTQTYEDARTQDLIHLRSAICIFSNLWIHT